VRIHLIHGESGPSSNTWFLSWAHSSRQLYFTTNRPFLPPLKLPFPIMDLDLHLIHASVGRHTSSPNGISIGSASAVFAQLTADGVECPYTLQWAAPSSPSKLPLSMGIWNSTQYMVPWVHPSPQPKRHLGRFSRFCRAH